MLCYDALCLCTFIGAIIGKGGETIQRIQRETGTTITITEEQVDGVSQGVVDIFGLDKESMDKALNWINGITAVPEPGTVYHGKIVSILEFGAFVEILPGKEGLLHVSEIDWKKTEKVEDVLKVGDEVDVKLLEIDEKTGKMRLSRKALLAPSCSKGLIVHVSEDETVTSRVWAAWSIVTSDDVREMESFLSGSCSFVPHPEMRTSIGRINVLRNMFIILMGKISVNIQYYFKI